MNDPRKTPAYQGAVQISGLMASEANKSALELGAQLGELTTQVNALSEIVQDYIDVFGDPSKDEDLKESLDKARAARAKG